MGLNRLAGKKLALERDEWLIFRVIVVSMWVCVSKEPDSIQHCDCVTHPFPCANLVAQKDFCVVICLVFGGLVDCIVHIMDEIQVSHEVFVCLGTGVSLHKVKDRWKRLEVLYQRE
jgi:hypothetical protein